MLRKTIAELTRIFDTFNQEFYRGQLPETMIIVQSTARSKAYGCVTVKQVWSDKEGSAQRYELTIGSEYLNRTIYEIAGTVLHECVHLWNLKNDIKDCSGKNHNKKFKRSCDDIGLMCSKEPKIGWGSTELNEYQRRMVDALEIDEDAFGWFRQIVPAPPTPTVKKFRYTCTCGQKFESKDEVEAMCPNCNCDFVLIEE